MCSYYGVDSSATDSPDALIELMWLQMVQKMNADSVEREFHHRQMQIQMQIQMQQSTQQQNMMMMCMYS